MSYLGHSLVGITPTAEMQSVYSTAPTDLGKKINENEKIDKNFNIARELKKVEEHEVDCDTNLERFQKVP